ncbi:uncharacterized protein LOC132196670 [Neocloeon triangulifer]|uniref:uncharacterized protein LOC132196669 n=1 Tax=Neocloeon triangulifer TaxID=2078957 RepID=UPI00286F2CE9|nr:uncharacterized protein LOC132196669 [Neocloeon triangulifer]XP_059475452.1 uncharacterized protein LOC132196670 [Neocloeon triangulifer]
MEYEQLGCLKLAGLSEVKNNLRWSPDNKIAVITRKGVHVVAPHANVKSAKDFSLTSTLIIPQNDFPTHNTELDVDSIFLNHPERAAIYEMVLDPMLYKGVKHTESQLPVAIQAEWAPITIDGFDGHILAVRTSSGGVYLYRFKLNEWQEFQDISHKKYELAVKYWHNSSNNPDNLRSRVNELYATALCWESDEAAKVLTLWVAYGDCTLVSWKIGLDGASFKSIVVLKNMTKVTHIAWNGFLVVGDIKGIVHLNFPSDEKTVEFWTEQDLIPVESSLMFPCTSEGWFLIIVKGSCIVAARVSSDGTAVQRGTKNFGSLGITGLVHLQNNDVLVSHLCGKIEEVSLTLSESEISFQVKTLEHKLNTKDCNLHGIAISKNSLIYVVSQSAFTPHDHLVLREPSQLVFFTYNNAQAIWRMLEEIQFSESFVLENIWDILKILSIRGEPEDWQKPENLNIVEEIPILHRRLLLQSIDESRREPQTQIAKDLKKSLERLDKNIIAKQLLRVLSNLKPDRSDLEEYSKQLMTNWLKLYDPSNATNLTKEELALIIGLPTGEFVEKCNICSNDVIFDSSLEMTCVKGHKLPRCCLSLLQCSETPYRLCNECNQYCLLDPPFELEPRCIFCYHPMIEENFFK